MTPVSRPFGMSDMAWCLVERMTKSHPSDRIDMTEVTIKLKKLADEEAEEKLEEACR